MHIHLLQTDSTNRVAREEVLAGAAAGTVVWADSQVDGKGQYGRSFSSPPGGLYFSLILRPELAPERLPLITLATGLACRDVLARMYSLEILLKWPNDLFLHGKKVGGILCENFFDNRRSPSPATVIIGVGINANGSSIDFPEQLHGLVTTIAEWHRARIHLPALLACLVAQIESAVAMLQSESAALLKRWQQYDFLLDKPLRYTNGSKSFIGIGTGIGCDGRYRLVDEHGHEHAIIGGQLRPLHWPAEESLLPERQHLQTEGK